jgi:hypothetical protein
MKSLILNTATYTTIIDTLYSWNSNFKYHSMATLWHYRVVQRLTAISPTIEMSKSKKSIARCFLFQRKHLRFGNQSKCLWFILSVLKRLIKDYFNNLTLWRKTTKGYGKSGYFVKQWIGVFCNLFPTKIRWLMRIYSFLLNNYFSKIAVLKYYPILI